MGGGCIRDSFQLIFDNFFKKYLLSMFLYRIFKSIVYLYYKVNIGCNFCLIFYLVILIKLQIV